MNNVRIFILLGLMSAACNASEGENFNPSQQNLHQAMLNNSAEEVTQTIFSVIHQDKESVSYASLKAIMNDSTEEIKQAAQVVLNQGKDEKAPLLWAVLLQKFNALKVLLGFGAKLDSSTAQFAVNMGNLKSVLEIVKHGEDISGVADDCMRLCIEKYACSISERDTVLELIQELINRGYDINKMWNLGPNNMGQEFTISGSLLEFLIKKGARPNHVFEKNKDSLWTPLVLTIVQSDKQSVQTLLDAGADINQPANPYPNHSKLNIHGLHTPLYFAVAFRKNEIVELLLERGAKL